MSADEAASPNRHGWHPRRMPCLECDGDPTCEACNGTGHHPSGHAVNDALFQSGRCVALVESFADRGPFYANAITPEGRHVRRGACASHSDAAEWAERVVGLRPLREGDLK